MERTELSESQSTWSNGGGISENSEWLTENFGGENLYGNSLFLLCIVALVF